MLKSANECLTGGHHLEPYFFHLVVISIQCYPHGFEFIPVEHDGYLKLKPSFIDYQLYPHGLDFILYGFIRHSIRWVVLLGFALADEDQDGQLSDWGQC